MKSDHSISLNLRFFGDPILREKGEPVTEFNGKLRAIAKELIRIMHIEDGAGIAAQQCGLALQIFTIDMRYTPPEVLGDFTLDGKSIPADILMPLVVINPRIEILGKESQVWDEGCLSFPGIRGSIERPAQLAVHYQDLDGKEHCLKCSERLADCVAHEYDHIHGVLFIDRMPPQELNPQKTKIKQLKRQTQKELKKQSK